MAFVLLVLTDTPVFQDKSGEYESKTMKYNFKTQRGYITEVITEQQDGYLTGGKAKRTEDGAFYVEDGKYTTCEDHTVFRKEMSNAPRNL